MPNVDPDFHYRPRAIQPETAGSLAFRGLALVCAIIILAGLIDMLVAIPLSKRLDGSVLFYSVPALIILVAVFKFRTIDKHGTLAGMIAFGIASLAHAGNLFLAGLSDMHQFFEVWFAFVRIGLFVIYGIMMVAGFGFLATSDLISRDIRKHFNHR